jgi:transcription initiation factor TFIIE subunit alpha
VQPFPCGGVRSQDWEPRFKDKEIQQYLIEEAGEDSLPVFEYILKNEPISGVDILEAFGDAKPSEVRKKLYRLMQAHALEYHKDTDTKGWETFEWRTDLPELKLIHIRRWQDELRHLRKQLQFEKDHEFYACPHRHRRIIFEDAMDLEFHCPVCSEPMEPIDNQDVLAALQERIDEIVAALPE